MGALWTGCCPAAGHNRRLDCGEGCHSAGLRLYSVLNRIVLYRPTLYFPMSEVSESYQVIRRDAPRRPKTPQDTPTSPPACSGSHCMHR